MKTFLDGNFVLDCSEAEELYHQYAKELPIIDYHCHLSPKDIAENRKFNNLTEIWLEGDHYKWRAMRTHGVDERYCTGDAEPYQKFEKWAETVPYTLRNPLYHWTHMELKRPFGIQKLLSPATAREIYDECTHMLQQDEFTTQGILKQMKVEVVCTTDDPTDTLEYHQQIRNSGIELKVLPTFRPDKTLAVEDPATYNNYLNKLGEITNKSIEHFIDLLDALQQRLDFFHEMGGRLSDHGLERIYAVPFSDQDVNHLFHKVRLGNMLNSDEAEQIKSAVLYHLGHMYHEKNWTQQFHLGALRNNSTRMKMTLGPDTGFDSIGDFEMARPLSRYLDSLDNDNRLAKTILYNLNPRDNALMATMIGNFNDGSVAGKMQFGTGWWFLDQKNGMEDQIQNLSNMGLLSHFVGMLTDSRSFLSYPRHDYFRRILCNILGEDIRKGLIPRDMEMVGNMVKNISYYNARNYFGFYENS